MSGINLFIDLPLIYTNYSRKHHAYYECYVMFGSKNTVTLRVCTVVRRAQHMKITFDLCLSDKPWA